MSSLVSRAFLLAGSFAMAYSAVYGQGLTRVDPGLESAVKWKWRAVPSNVNDWGLPIPEAAPPPTLQVPGQSATAGPTPFAGDTYVVKSGDRLVFIAKHVGRTVNQIKTFNALTSDLIRVGQVLKIPTLEEARAIEPFPVTAVKTPGGKGKKTLSKQTIPDDLAVKVFLDRAQFSAGPIGSKNDLLFGKVLQLYQTAHPEAADFAALKTQAQAALNDGLTTYVLKPEDFRFIAPPKASVSDAKPSKSGQPHPDASATKYQDMTSTTMLAYQTPWEFVAERFHCDEAFLRQINGQVKKVPAAGTELFVPNVVPFEIEKALEEPLQPRPDPQAPITTSVNNMELFVIYRAGVPIAAMPISSARPGLRGKGTWTLVKALARPRLATLRETREQAAPPKPLFGAGNPDATPTPAKPILATEEYLPPGPNNPVGVIWISLAKADNPEILPYGLHGTNVPEKMNTTESLGGFRLTNWDIAGAVRLLPPETPLEWKQMAAMPPAPAAAAPAALPAR